MLRAFFSSLLAARNINHFLAVCHLHTLTRLTRGILRSSTKCLLMLIKPMPTFPSGVLNALRIKELSELLSIRLSRSIKTLTI